MPFQPPDPEPTRVPGLRLEASAAYPQGALLWDPIHFLCGIGGAAQESFSRPGIVAGVAVFPLRSGELVGINQNDGSILWQSDPIPEMYPRQLYPDGDSLLGVTADNRSLDVAGNGTITRIDARTGLTEKVWEGYGYTMSEPALTDALMVTRTARPKLVALSRGEAIKVVWETPLKTYKPISPVIAGDLVLTWDGEVTKEQVILKAFDIQNGKLVWQAEILEIDCSPVAANNLLVYRTGKKQLTAVHLNNGEQAWRKKVDRIYSRPVADGKRLYMIMSDNPDVSAPGHYSLQCLDVETAEPLWTAPLGIRAQEILPQPDGTLLIGMGDPEMAICSSQDGSVLWRHCFGEEKINRVQTHLAVQDGICWVGTYEGKISAIRVSEPLDDIVDPETSLRKGDLEGAAAAFALTGKFSTAAKLYLEKLDQPKKALSIYEQLNDLPGQVNAWLLLGDELSAANLLAKAGKTLEAAPLYEKANELRTAMQLYKQAGSEKDVERLRGMIPLEYSDIEVLENEGKWVEAGDGAMKLGDYQKAFTLFDRAGEAQREKALEALTRLVNDHPEPWALSKMAEIRAAWGIIPSRPGLMN
ncbi:MAG: PQQ-binding-like beta-propeller repeat protein [Anaerolineaceae bacterium]